MLGTPGIAKPSGPVGSLKHSHQHSNFPNPSASPSSLFRPPQHHSWRKSPVHEKLARLLEDSPASVASTIPMAQPEPTAGVERRRSASPPSSTSSDVEMMEAEPAPRDHGSPGPEEDFLGPIILPEDDEDDEDYEDDQDDEDDEDEDSEDGGDAEKEAIQEVQPPMIWTLTSTSSGQVARRVQDEANDVGGVDGLVPSIEMAAPDRPYTKWRGEYPFQCLGPELHSPIL